jgi:peptidoglycan/xylan/chitin deacetylase (PgdA/CDA1 family)
LPDRIFVTATSMRRRIASPRGLVRSALLRATGGLRLDGAARLWHGPGEIRVLNLHGTPTAHADRFRKQLEWAQARFELLTPERFFAILAGRLATPTRPGLLYTFDDGLLSNYEWAAPMLESMGTRGLFFVNPAFAMVDGEMAKSFFYSRICPRDAVANGSSEEWMPMNAKHIRALCERGHTIGNHTYSHASLSSLCPERYDKEIGESADILQKWTGAACDAFAWTFAWSDITPETWERAAQTHTYCFSACPGVNRIARTESTLIWRTNVECHLEPFEYRFFYSGLADPFWTRPRRRLRRMRAGLHT